ncbi:MAG: amino acid permease [Flavobacteriales bacterium]|nr:amino acid permease [Flavobacteriales bacterium]
MKRITGSLRLKANLPSFIYLLFHNHLFCVGLPTNIYQMKENTSQTGGHLTRSFGLNMAIVLVVSNIIGSGVFKKVAPMSELLLSPQLIILAWLIAGLITLFGILSIAELGTLFPESGGAYAWLEKIYGRSVSFFYGWSCFTVIQTAAISSIAYVFAGAAGTFINLPHLSPELESIHLFNTIYPFANIGAKVVACILIIILTMVNIRGTKLGASVSQLFTWIIVSCIVLIIAAGLSSAAGSWVNYHTNSQAYPPTSFGSSLGILGVMVIAIRHAFWGYEGWISLGYVGAEIRNPQRNIPRALVSGILIVIASYILLNFTYLFVMPIDDLLTEVRADENNIAAVLVINRIFGQGGAYIISAMILVSTLGCTNTTILTASRIYYAMSNHGLFFKKAGKTHVRFNTPSNSLIIQAIWACILIFSGSFDFLTDLLIFAGFIFYGMVVFGVIWLRLKNKTLPRSYKTWGYPVLPLIFVLFSILLVGISIYEMPLHSLIGLFLILSGLPFYLIWRKRINV